ncbi:MAG TPA: hypothetical protein VH092_38130 [Urbifossiella sp.]|jgi:hypothetical protein|nr:hypothetical protein [Urbifossiella sp.]
MKATRRLWLVLPVVVLCVADVGLTLVGQPEGYWSGRYELAHEANPVARPALARGPAAFVALGLGYAGTVAVVVCWWRHPAAAWAAALVAAAQAFGGAGWLVRSGPWGWAAAAAFLATAAEGSARCWRRAARPDPPLRQGAEWRRGAL